MSSQPLIELSANLFDRARNLLLQPRVEWDRIASEPASLGKLYAGYVLPMAVLWAIALTAGQFAFPNSGGGGFGYHQPVSPGSAIAQGATQLLLVFAAIFALAQGINALAPTFSAEQKPDQAHKLAIYSATPALLAGVSTLVPGFWIVGLVGVIYALVLLYLGLPRLMQAPGEKRASYFVAIILLVIALYLLAAMVMTTVRTSF